MKFNKLSNYILILLLGLVSFAIYSNSLQGEFLVDDQPGILNNERIHNLKVYFSKYFNLRPGVLWELTQVFNWQISKGQPYTYHLFNVLIHVVCVVLLFILCNTLFKNKTLSFLSSLIFAIHPIHTEAVSWISGGSYALSSLFFIAAFIFYIKSDNSLYYLALSVIFFALCFFAGNAVATLPIIFILYDLFFREYKDKSLRRIRLGVLFLMLVIVSLFVGINFIGRNKFIHTIFYFRGATYLIVIAKALLYYLKILYLPIQRGLYHTFAYNTMDTAKLTPAFFMALIIIFVSIFLFFKCRKNAKPITFSIAFFFINYLPYSNVIPVCNIISERYMYLPSAGFAIIMAYGVLKVWRLVNENTEYKTILRYIIIIAFTLFLGSYSLLTLKHNIDYSNIITYWETNINNFPDGYKAYNNLAGTYYTMGNREQAAAYCLVNLMINPNQAHVWCNLGKVYREMGDLKLAADCYREALNLDRDYFPALKGLTEVERELAHNKK